MGLEAGIWASRLRYGPGGWGEGGRGAEEEKKEKEKEEKIPMCESIGHRPLRGRCPKNDRPSLRLVAQADARESRYKWHMVAFVVDGQRYCGGDYGGGHISGRGCSR